MDVLPAQLVASSEDGVAEAALHRYVEFRVSPNPPYGLNPPRELELGLTLTPNSRGWPPLSLYKICFYF